MLALLVVAGMTMTVHAQGNVPTQFDGANMAPRQAWAGEKIRQASLNWADYQEEPISLAASQQTWDGEKIRQASLNWADYQEEPIPLAASQQTWDGETVHPEALAKRYLLKN